LERPFALVAPDAEQHVSGFEYPNNVAHRGDAYPTIPSKNMTMSRSRAIACALSVTFPLLTRSPTRACRAHQGVERSDPWGALLPDGSCGDAGVHLGAAPTQVYAIDTLVGVTPRCDVARRIVSSRREPTTRLRRRRRGSICRASRSSATTGRRLRLP
jgi:hypothetical protein